MVSFFAFCICEGTGSDGDAESGRNVICQCDFGVEETDTIGFLYSFDEIKVDRKISLDVKNVKVDDVLQYILGNNFTWEYVDNMVIIKPIVLKQSQKKSLRVKGFVYDTQKQPLPGVTVKVAGVPLGTATDTRGWFAMDLPMTEGMLEFSFVGYQLRQVKFTAASDTLRIFMEEDVNN